MRVAAWETRSTAVAGVGEWEPALTAEVASARRTQATATVTTQDRGEGHESAPMLGASILATTHPSWWDRIGGIEAPYFPFPHPPYFPFPKTKRRIRFPAHPISLSHLP